MHGKWKTPGHTIPSFTATMTGRQYNVCNFHWDDGKGEYQRHRQTGFDYLWEQTEASMSLLNIPTLYPPEEIDDAMVSGFLTPDDLVESNLARPLELQKYLKKIDYTHDVHADNTYDELGGEGMLEYLDSIMRTRADAATHIIEEYDSDLFYGVWTSPDRWFHQCHLHDEEIMPMYEKADELLDYMLKLLPDEVPLVVFSDHGFGHFSGDKVVHKGHMYEGFYAVRTEAVPSYRDDSASIFDLHPTVLNYLEGETAENSKGRVLFHQESQDQQVKDRLEDLGYLE